MIEELKKLDFGIKVPHKRSLIEKIHYENWLNFWLYSTASYMRHSWKSPPDKMLKWYNYRYPLEYHIFLSTDSINRVYHWKILDINDKTNYFKIKMTAYFGIPLISIVSFWYKRPYYKYSKIIHRQRPPLKNWLKSSDRKPQVINDVHFHLKVN